MFTDKKLPRREFLRISSTAIAGTAAVTIIPGGDSLLAAIATPASGMAPLLSIGYVDKAPATDASVRLGYASSLISGDTEFLSRPALITLTSFSRHMKVRGNGATFEVDAVYPAQSYAASKFPRFRAFFAIDQNGTEAGSPGARFSLPVTATGGAQFVIRRLNADGKATDAASNEVLLALSTGVESGTLKLQRGVYVVAFRERAGDDVPNWAGYKLVNDKGVLYIPNAQFSYVLMTVDYAE